MHCCFKACAMPVHHQVKFSRRIQATNRPGFAKWVDRSTTTGDSSDQILINDYRIHTHNTRSKPCLPHDISRRRNNECDRAQQPTKDDTHGRSSWKHKTPSRQGSSSTAECKQGQETTSPGQQYHQPTVRASSHQYPVTISTGIRRSSQRRDGSAATKGREDRW
jgi:hypothetical protein